MVFYLRKTVEINLLRIENYRTQLKPNVRCIFSHRRIPRSHTLSMDYEYRCLSIFNADSNSSRNTCYLWNADDKYFITIPQSTSDPGSTMCYNGWRFFLLYDFTKSFRLNFRRFCSEVRGKIFHQHMPASKQFYYFIEQNVRSSWILGFSLLILKRNPSIAQGQYPLSLSILIFYDNFSVNIEQIYPLVWKQLTVLHRGPVDVRCRLEFVTKYSPPFQQHLKNKLQ